MKTEIQQRNFIRKQKLTFDDLKLNVIWKSYGNREELEIPFENILPNKFDIKKNHIFLFIISSVFYLISGFVYYWRLTGDNVEDFAEVFWFSIATIFLLIALLTREKYWQINISNNTFIKIYKTSPNEYDVNEFITNLFEQRNIYLLSNYGDLNLNADYENQLNKLVWLRKMKVLDDNSYQAKRAELDKMFSTQKNKIGS